MFSDLKFFWMAQPASAFMFAAGLCALVASAVGIAAQFARGNVMVGAISAVVVLVCALMAWMLGAATLAVAIQCRLNGITDEDHGKAE